MEEIYQNLFQIIIEMHVNQEIVDKINMFAKEFHTEEISQTLKKQPELVFNFNPRQD